ncbi:MAG: tetratricopeptide repeat protein [Chitinispirillaceae bacterium]|jgi:protein O-mannosyl-transferase
MSKKKGHSVPPPKEKPTAPSYRNLSGTLLAAIVLLTVVAYSRSLNCGFTNWDDNEYTFYAFQQLQQLKSSFGNIVSFFIVPNGHGGFDPAYVKGNFHPLSMLSMTLDYCLSPASPATIPPVTAVVFHTVNILFHILNTLLVFLFIYRMAQFFLRSHDRMNRIDTSNAKQSAIAVAAATAILFGVHPLHVESVAWVSERKDVLYAFWFLLSLIAYLRYIRRGKVIWYALSLLFFLLSLFSKGQAVFLAIVLTLIDIVAGRRPASTKVIVEKISYYLLAILFGIIAVKAQAAGNAIPHEQSGFLSRIIFASTAFSLYLAKAIAPTGLSTLYGYPDTAHGLSTVYYLAVIPPTLVLIGVFYGLKKSRALFFGLLFFVAGIILLLQFIPVGRALMADRYMYVASIGLFFLAGFAMEKTPLKWRWGARTLMVLVALVFTGLSAERCAVWQNSITLWNDCIDSKNNTPSIAFHNRAQARFEVKDYRGAIHDETEAIKLEPTLADAYYNRANSEFTIGEIEASIRDNTRCLELNPKHFYAYYLRASAKMSTGRQAEAMNDFDSSIANCSQFKLGFFGRALCREGMGNWKGAIDDYTQVIRLDVNYADGYFRRALAYQQINNPASACADLHAAAHLGNPQAAGMIKSACGSY